jgi:DNA-binding MarR family transcriptional regulator
VDDDRAVLGELLPRLTRLSELLSRGRLFEQVLESAGLALERPAITVLVTLHRAGGPLRVGEIATRMQVAGPHVTRHVQGLERRGLVRRVEDPADQRARLIEATPAGADAAERYLSVLLGWLSDALAGWPRQDRQDLVRLLGRLLDDVHDRVAAAAGGEPEPPLS